MINIILYRPEKPSNVGNIIRTCASTDSKLIIIGPLSFNLTDKELKRAGMDYINMSSIKMYDNLESFNKDFKNKKIFYVTRYSKNIYSQNDYSKIEEEISFMFGRESSGIPHDILKNNFENTIRIPMVMSARSLNLSNCVALVLFEALRQRKFFGLSTYESIKGEDFLFNEKND